MNPTTVELNVKLRSGAPVMLFAYFKAQQRSYVGAFENKGTWVGCSWNKDGTYLSKKVPTPMDLIINRDWQLAQGGLKA